MNQPPPKASKQSVWSLVFGILSVTCLWIFGSIPAIILGVIGMKKAKENPGVVGGHGMALAGLICGCVGIVAGLFPIAIAVSLIMPGESGVRERAYGAKDINNVRQAILGLHTYAADHDGKFPATLGDLYPDYLDNLNLLKTTPKSGDDSEQIDYLYRPGFTSASDPAEPIILSPIEFGQKYAVGYVGGYATPISSDMIEPIRAKFEK